MNQKTYTAAIQFLAALARDPDAHLEVELYGNYASHIEDHLNDAITEDD